MYFSELSGYRFGGHDFQETYLKMFKKFVYLFIGTRTKLTATVVKWVSIVAITSDFNSFWCIKFFVLILKSWRAGSAQSGQLFSILTCYDNLNSSWNPCLMIGAHILSYF